MSSNTPTATKINPTLQELRAQAIGRLDSYLAGNSHPEQAHQLFYKDEQALDKESYQIKCEGVSKFNCTLDAAAELKNNMFAGNISNAYLKENTQWVYFTDGLLEVHAKKFRLGKS